jgi:hypothetical protein
MSHVLPDWIGRLLSVDAASGEDVVWALDWTWPWPPWATLLLVVVVAASVVAIYLRERPRLARRWRLALAAMRLTLMALVLLMICQVTLTAKRAGLPYAAVLVDDSSSMNLFDSYPESATKSIAERIHNALGDAAEMSRWNLAKTFLLERNAERLHRLADEYRVRMYSLTKVDSGGQKEVDGFAKELRPAKAVGESTRLGLGARTILDDLRGAGLAALVVLSDGVNTDGPPLSEMASAAKRRGTPLFVIGLGSDRGASEARLSDLLANDVAFVGDLVSFECKLTTTGLQGRKLSIVLHEKDRSEALAKVEVTAVADQQPQPIRLSYRVAKPGRFEYWLSGETSGEGGETQSNRLAGEVDVRKEKIRVLLVQGYPNFEFRYLRNMLQRDDTIALDTVLQEADPDHTQQDASALRAFPVGRDELFRYDAVILGDADPSLLNPSGLQYLADFVDQRGKGGALVLIAGPRFMPKAYGNTPLARMMPFDAANVVAPDADKLLRDGFVVRPTEIGLASPAMQLGNSPEETLDIWRHLPPLYWLLRTPQLKPGVRVLAEAGDRVAADGRPVPAICLQYVGAGKVLFHAIDETWRWRWRAGDVYFARYWVQTIRFLCRTKLAEEGPAVVLSSGRREYANGETIRLRADFAEERLAPAEDDGVRIVVEHPGQPSQQVTMHRVAVGRGGFEGELPHASSGSYRAWIASPSLEGSVPTVEFVVAPPAGESVPSPMNAADLRQAAEQSGGRFYTFETADRLLSDLPAGRRTAVESLPPYPLWNRWPLLAVFLTLLTAEWILRKRKGLV